MKRSDTIGALSAALAKAQAQIRSAEKDGKNPHFSSRYSTLASIIDAIRQPFAANGIAWMQFTRTGESGVEVETMFSVQTADGDEFVSETLSIPVSKKDAQGIGSALTYAKRYSLQSMAGVPSDDDDGNDAVQSVKNFKDECMKALREAAKDGPAVLKAAWTEIGPEGRAACKEEIQKLTDMAAKVKEPAHA